MEKPRFTLRSKLSVALVSLAVVPLVVTAAVLAGLNIFVVSAQALEFRLAVADSAADRVDSLLEEVQSELVGMGQLLLRRDLTPEQIEKLVTAALSGSRRLHHLAVYTPSGKRLVHYHGRNVVAPVSPADELQDDLRYTARQQPFIPLRLEWRDGRPYLPLLLAVFDRSKGKRSLFAYLWASVSLRSLSSSLADLSARRFSRRRNRIYLIDHRFRVLAHGDPSQIGRDAPEAVKRSGLSLQRDTGVTLPLMFRGVKQLAALQSIPTVHWAVVVLQPEGEVFRTIRNTWWTAIAVGFGAGAVALLLGLLMGRRLAKPVVQLAEAAQRVATGTFDAPVAVETRDEIGLMANAFNTMARDLRDYHARIIEETRIRTDLGRYLNEDLVEDIVQRREALQLGGQRHDVTVMFADLVAFTPFAEAHRPEDVVAVLNEVFTVMTEIIFRHHGIVDKFIGDCVMAVFGAPSGRDEHTLDAVRAAEEIVRWLDAGNARWQKVLGRELQIGIGINCGEAIVGNIGSTKRMEYTVIGDIVNVAARLEVLARPNQVIVTRDVAERVEHAVDLVSLGEQMLAGRLQPVEIFSVAEE